MHTIFKQKIDYKHEGLNSDIYFHMFKDFPPIHFLFKYKKFLSQNLLYKFLNYQIYYKFIYFWKNFIKDQILNLTVDQ